MTYAKNPKKKWYCYNDSSCKVWTFARNPVHEQAVVDRKEKKKHFML